MTKVVRCTFISALTVVSTLLATNAHAADVPQSFTLDGRLYSDTAGTVPLTDSSITFRVQILDEDKLCILYEEQQNYSTLASKGYFSIQVGTVTGSTNRTADDSGHTMATVFQNINNVTGKLVSNGSPCSAIATGAKRRYVRIAIAPSTLGGAERLLSPDLTIDSVPNAVVAERAESLQGYRSAEFLKVNTAAGSVLSQTNLENLFTNTTRFSALSTIVDGTSTSYMRSNSAAGAQLPVMAGAPTAPTTGSVWYDSSDSKMKFQTAGGPVTVGTSGGGSALSALTAASTANTIDNSNYAQAWNWSTALTETPLVFSANALTTGTLLDVTTSSASLNSTNGLFRVANTGAATTGIVARIQANSTAGSGLTVLASGNVGVGTSAPTSLLQIDGAAPRVVNFSSSGTVQNAIRSDNNGMVLYQGATPNSNNALWLMSNGHTDGDYVFNVPDAATKNIRFRNNSAGWSAAEIVVSKMTGSNSNGTMLLKTTGHAVNQLFLDAGGNVGIGTTAPATALDLNGAWSVRGMAAPAASVATQGRIYFDSTANKFKVSENNGAYVDLVSGGSGTVSGTTGKIAKFTSGTAVGDSVITELGGNIGIGTATPSTALHAIGVFTLGDGTNSPISMNPAGGLLSIAGTTSISGNGYISGNVGIGTTSPSTALDLNGAWSVRGMAAPATSVATQGRIYFDSTANKFKISENNGAYVDLVRAGGNISGLTTGKIPKATSATALGDSVITEASSKIGIGSATPAETLDVNGAIKLGTTATSNAGTIRWDGTNFQGYNGAAWTNFVPNPPTSGTCDTTDTYSIAGTYIYTVPVSFGTITIRLWGGGGEGSNRNGNPGANGGNSTILSLGLNAGGGSSATTTGGAGGTASGGTVNTNGAAGGTTNGSVVGPGGNAPGGGGIGGVASGAAGSAPGGGGAGGSYGGLEGSGGGSGSYVEKTFTTATLTPGATLNDILVAAGGNSGGEGGDGGAGRISISCATAGQLPANDRGIVFWDAGSHASATTFVYSAAGNVGIGTSNPGEKLDVTGNIRSSGQLSTSSQTITGGTTAIDWNNGNTISTDYGCASSFAFANLRDGGTYTLAVTDTGTTQCNFSTTTTGTDAATVTYRFKPANAARTASSHTIYTLMRIGTVVYVSWASGF